MNSIIPIVLKKCRSTLTTEMFLLLHIFKFFSGRIGQKSMPFSNFIKFCGIYEKGMIYSLCIFLNRKNFMCISHKMCNSTYCIKTCWKICKNENLLIFIVFQTLGTIQFKFISSICPTLAYEIPKSHNNFSDVLTFIKVH